MAFAVIIFSAALIGIALYLRQSKINRAMDNGDMIKRDSDFFKQNHTFQTNIASIDIIYDALDKGAIERDTMECSLSSGQYIVFKKYIAGQGMTASLRSVGESNGLHAYKFSVESFTTRKGMEAGYTDANIALTTVEKAIFSLDSTAQVERIHGSYKTKWL